MIISVNWLKKFTKIDGTIDELSALIGSRLVEIEEVLDIGTKYQGVIVARVVECTKLENSDHLNVTKIDDGQVVDGIERDENGYVQVVCGAPNVREGLLVAWLPPNSTVPESFNDKEPFVLGARKLRGVMSNGMLASAKELDLFDDHEGILEIDKDAAPGSLFAEVYELNDHLLDIENKSLTHRPDTFGVVGFAREVAAIQGIAFETPGYLNVSTLDFGMNEGGIEQPRITIEDSRLSSRYQAVVIGNIDAKKQSDLERQTLLARVGVRPISAVVDVTNYLMMQTGQPLHAFDYDKLKAVNNGTIDVRVRAGRIGEKLTLLDGRTIELSDDDIVVANGDTPVALAGAMGGAATEVTDNTTTILLESATFNLYNLRNTQMRHGIFSEAITRVTKGQPAETTAPVLAAATREMTELCGGKRLSDVGEAYPGRTEPQAIVVDTEYVNQMLGSKFTAADIVETLENVEFSVTTNEDNSSITSIAPYWRSDIHIPEDIIEEVGRLNGFDTIEPTLPTRNFAAVSPSEFDQARADMRRTLVRAGANEVLTYSFIHGDVIKKAGQKTENSYRITNSISPDLQYYRQTLTPSILSLVHANSKTGFDEFALFELNKTHNKLHGLNDESVPRELDSLAFATTSKKTTADAPYYKAKKYLDYLAQSFGLNLTYDSIDSDIDDPVAAPFEYRRSALVSIATTGEVMGIVGEYKKSVTKAFKLPEASAGFEIDPRAIAAAVQQNSSGYTPLSKYPGTSRDICFKLSREISYQRIIDSVRSELDTTDLSVTIEPVDIYREKDSESKNVTIRISFVSSEKTLDGSEINTKVEAMSARVCDTLNAVVV